MVRSISAALALLVVGSMCVQAQDKPAAAVSVVSRGGAASVALESMAQSLGYSLKYGADVDVESDVDFHVWVRLKDAAPDRAARVMGFACGMNVRIDVERKLLVVGGEGAGSARGALLKGYDVSVAASRFVAYENAWGAPKAAAKEPASDDKSAPEAERSAAQRLADLLEYLLSDERGGPQFAVAGDRLLLRDQPAMHARVGELLDLLVNDTGGHSAESRAESAVVAALRKAKPPLALQETPRASVLAQLCEAAGVDFAIRAENVDWLEEDHATLELSPEATVMDALQATFNADTAGWVIADGVVSVGHESYTPLGFKVFETAELLKKLDAGVRRQRTEADRRNGFSGDLRSQGGVDVIVNATLKVLETSTLYVMVETWGSRVVVRGSQSDIELAEAALKEMGWEPPKGN